MKTPLYIEVVRSNIKGLSSLSNESATAIVASLARRYSNVALTVVNTTEDLAALIERKPDLVFLGMMYVTDSPGSEKGAWLSEELERADIPHTGSTRFSHELELHKDQAKHQVLAHGLATARFQVIAVDQPCDKLNKGLSFPLFVKPISGGGGKGVDEHSIVRTHEQLQDKVASLRARYNTDVLVEDYLEGREFSVAVIKDPLMGELIAMPLELVAPKDSNGQSMLSSKVKSSNQEQAIGVSNRQERALLATFALDVFRALGARDYGRIDIRFDSKGIPHFLEANLIPSLISGYGSFPKAYKLDQGVEYDEMIHTIASLGLARTTALAY